MNYHLQTSNSPPDYFITLSCAEYYWPDIMRLLKERYQLSGVKDIDIQSNMSLYINEMTMVIQEYFQERVRNWICTVGKVVFGIKHYWLHYEFAPGRGQIHCHMIALSDSTADLHLILSETPENTEKAKILNQFLKSRLEMTCNLPEGQPIYRVNDKNPHPASLYFDPNQNKDLDKAAFLCTTQNHVCSTYCLRKRKRM